MENLKDIGGFLDIYNLPKLNQDKIRNVNRFSTSSEKQVAIKISQPKTGPNAKYSTRPSKNSNTSQIIPQDRN